MRHSQPKLDPKHTPTFPAPWLLLILLLGGCPSHEATFDRNKDPNESRALELARLWSAGQLSKVESLLLANLASISADSHIRDRLASPCDALVDAFEQQQARYVRVACFV